MGFGRKSVSGLSLVPQVADLAVAARDRAEVELFGVRMKTRPRLVRQAVENRLGDQQVFLGRDRVLEQPVGDDHVGAVQLLDAAQPLARETSVMNDELQL